MGVDGTVLERIAKIMAYLRLGSSGKVPMFLSCSSWLHLCCLRGLGSFCCIHGCVEDLLFIDTGS